MSKFTKEKELEIVKMYKLGKSQKDIANFYNTFNTSIRRVLIRNNIKIRKGEKVLRLCKNNPFKRNCEYSEYFLGLLLTDGCISKGREKKNSTISLSLNERDGYIVEQFRNFINPNLKLQKVLQNLNNSYMHAVCFTNCEVEEWLKRKGNFNNKSYDCKIYTPITWNILRGIFDGDGGFHSSCNHLGFFICGRSLVFIEQIKNFLFKYGFTVYLRKRKNSISDSLFLYYVEIHKINEVLKLGELMYGNSHIFIKRKYDKWLAFYESRRAYTLNSGKEMEI